MSAHKVTKVELKGTELRTSSWIHEHSDGRLEATHLISLQIGKKDADCRFTVYVDESEIDSIIATFNEFKRNAVLTNREFAVAQNKAA